MTELLTAAQMRAIEQAAIASGEVTGLELMERAGKGVVEAIFEEWPELKATSHRAVVLCGPGNNGGDGFVVARLLKEWGWEVEVFLYGDPGKLPPDAKVNYERWRGMGEVRDAAEIEDEEQLEEMDAQIFVDALFGTGLTRPVDLTSGVLAPFFDFAMRWRFDSSPCFTVSVDIPSGICADSGQLLGFTMIPALTVTFHSAKRGHYLCARPRSDGSSFLPSKKLRTINIGLPSQHYQMLLDNIRRTLPQDQRDTVMLAGWQDWAFEKNIWQHKYTHGHALILSGPPGHTGAARLAARGALRIGAGLVTVGAPPEAIPEHAAQLNAIMLRPIANAGDLTETLADPRITALCLGPGLGLDERARGLVAAALASPSDLAPGPTRGPEASGAPEGRGPGSGPGRAKRPIVLDADALTLLARDPALFTMLDETCVLTPHAGEFARLFPDIAEKLAAPATKGPAYSKVDATRAAAKRAGCVVLYKGPDTVIADPAGRCSINSAHYDRAAPWLATAGSGDVLSGFIAGLLARGYVPGVAAEAAAWLHVECALTFGPGLIAEDLPEQLPAVFRKLGL